MQRQSVALGTVADLWDSLLGLASWLWAGFEEVVAPEAALSHAGVGKFIDEYLILLPFAGLILKPVPRCLPGVPRAELQLPWCYRA